MTEKTAQPQPQPQPNGGGEGAKPMLEELNFLKQHGEDVSDLQSGLEELLKSRPDVLPQPKIVPESQPSNVEWSYDAPLPINMRGEDVEIPVNPQPAPTPPPEAPKAPEPAPQSPPQPDQAQTAQEKALDPYRPDAPREQPKQDEPPKGEEFEPGEITFDAEGRARDAKTGKYVPHQALHAERVRRKEVESELQKQREEFTRAQERLNMLTEILEGQQTAQLQQQQPQNQTEEETEIDPKVDIFAAFGQLKKRNDALTQQLAETRDSTTKQYTQMQMAERYRQDATRFASENADFFDAYRYLLDTRKAELEVLGFTDPQAISQAIASEERALVQHELSRPGGRPAQKIYDLARAKGYRKKEAAPAPAPTPPAPQAAPQPQSQPAQTQPPQPDRSAIEQIQNIQNGSQANATLTGSGGSPGEGLTIKQLAEMPEDKFLDFAAKIGKDKLDRILRG